MSSNEIQRLLGKIIIDEGFRRQWVTQPRQALAAHGFELSEKELQCILFGDRAQAEALASQLDQYLHHSGWTGPQNEITCLKP